MMGYPGNSKERRPLSIAERLERNSMPEPNSGCWLWLGVLSPKGYGQLVLGKSESRYSRRAHRLSYETFRGPIPDGLHVLHKCDVPACINPEHLFLGTNDDNVADRVAKNRTSRGKRHAVLTVSAPGYKPPPRKIGETNPKAKLTAEKVRGIREASGTLVAIGKRFGISPQQVWTIRRGLHWKHTLEVSQ